MPAGSATISATGRGEEETRRALSAIAVQSDIDGNYRKEPSPKLNVRAAVLIAVSVREQVSATVISILSAHHFLE